MPHFQQSLQQLRQDPIIAQIIEEISALPQPKINPDLFEALLESIISQQLSVKAAATIHGRFVALLPEQTPRRLLEMSELDLRSVGLSGRKCEYVKEIAAFFTEHGEQDWAALEDERVRDQLISIRGVGHWTIDMILMFCLDRPDVFPLGDLIIKQAIGELYKLNPKSKSFETKAHKIARSWQPFRSDACLLLWAWNRELRVKS